MEATATERKCHSLEMISDRALHQQFSPERTKRKLKAKNVEFHI